MITLRQTAGKLLPAATGCCLTARPRTFLEAVHQRSSKSLTRSGDMLVASSLP
jgi:hypothetical protein